LKLVRLAVPLLVASVVAVLLAAALPETILAGDAAPYRERMVQLFAGGWPYFSFPFEHLPGMLVPLALPWLLGGGSGLSAYALALAGVSAAFLLATAAFLLRAEAQLAAPNLAIRWLLLTVPLLPFLLFRNDAWSILLAVAGIVLAMEGRSRASILALIAGVLSKIWPAVWAASEWWRGSRWRALALIIAAGGAVTITLTPAVQAIQDPRGLHTETLAGGMLGLGRALAGADLGIVNTATAYIAAPAWALVANLAVGGVLGVRALRPLTKPFSWEGAWGLTGALVGAGLLAAPYFSTQYVAWLAPFAAQHRRWTGPMLVVSLSSLLLIVNWHLLFAGTVWWWALLAGRNLVLVGLVWSMGRLGQARPLGAD
jgi:hypothetical protein